MNSTSQGNRQVTVSGPAAFTLIELLVVVAIITLMAVLLIPAISRAKTKAQQIRCVSNLRQLGVGLQNFLAGNHAYPSLISPTNCENPGLWISQLANGGFGISIPVTNPATNLLSNGIWRCPSAPLKMAPPNDDSDFSSYGYNAHGVARPGWPGNTNALGLRGRFVDSHTFIPGFPGFAPVNEPEVAVPAEMMAIGESISGGVRFDRLNRHNLRDPDRFWRAALARHQGRINVLFCDGHVESPTPQFLFEDSSDTALVRWNRDHQPHRESL